MKKRLCAVLLLCLLCPWALAEGPGAHTIEEKTPGLLLL